MGPPQSLSQTSSRCSIPESLSPPLRCPLTIWCYLWQAAGLLASLIHRGFQFKHFGIAQRKPSPPGQLRDLYIKFKYLVDQVLRSIGCSFLRQTTVSDRVYLTHFRPQCRLLIFSVSHSWAKRPWHPISARDGSPTRHEPLFEWSVVNWCDVMVSF